MDSLYDYGGFAVMTMAFLFMLRWLLNDLVRGTREQFERLTVSMESLTSVFAANVTKINETLEQIRRDILKAQQSIDDIDQQSPESSYKTGQQLKSRRKGGE